VRYRRLHSAKETMAYEIILGRDVPDREQFGLRGTILLGKHYVRMGQVETLSQPVYLDLHKAT
jgi:hypothetical protein